MWCYEKKLQYPVKIKCPNPAIATVVITQVGGPDGELGASMRYLSSVHHALQRVRRRTQRHSTEDCPSRDVSAIVHQLDKRYDNRARSKKRGSIPILLIYSGIFIRSRRQVFHSPQILPVSRRPITDLVEGYGSRACPFGKTTLRENDRSELVLTILNFKSYFASFVVQFLVFLVPITVS